MKNKYLLEQPFYMYQVFVLIFQFVSWKLGKYNR